MRGIPALFLTLAACNPAAQESPQSQESSAQPTIELVSVYVGSTTCLPCLTPEMKSAIRTIHARLADQAVASGRQHSAIGVALDWSVDEGVDLLRSTAAFDEIVVGRNWGNSAAIDLIWSDPQGRPEIPQIIVFERSIREGATRIEVGPKRILGRLVGGDKIPRWATAGASLTDLGDGVSGT